MGHAESCDEIPCHPAPHQLECESSLCPDIDNAHAAHISVYSMVNWDRTAVCVQDRDLFLHYLAGPNVIPGVLQRENVTEMGHEKDLTPAKAVRMEGRGHRQGQ